MADQKLTVGRIEQLTTHEHDFRPDLPKMAADLRVSNAPPFPKLEPPTAPAPPDVARTREALSAALRAFGSDATMEAWMRASGALTAHEAAIRADALRRVREKVEKERWTSTVAGVHTEWVPKRRVLEILDEELNHATL